MRGFLHCPHCGTRSHLYPEQQHKQEEESMPTVTSGGASSAWEDGAEPEAAPGAPVAAAAEAPEAPELEQGPATQAPALEGEHGPELTDLPGGGYVEPAAAPASGDYASMTQAALREEAKGRGLPSGGSKADLAGRLAEHDNQSAASAAEPKEEA